MAGCTVLPDPCEAPVDDPPTEEESANSEVVERFIQQVWNHCWTPDENATYLAERNRGNRAYVPAAVDAALQALRSPTTIRHRRGRDGRPIRSSGADDYATCVNAVHGVAQDIHITVIDLVGVGHDGVIAHLMVEGTDRRADGRTDKASAYGADRPTGQRFRQYVTTFYLVCDGMIREDRLLSGGEVTYLQAANAA